MSKKTLQELPLKFKGTAFRGTVLTDVSMKERTTMQVGGIAPLVIEPHDVLSLVNALRILQGQDTPAFIMGGGSNLVVSDEGFDCAVVSTRGLDAIRYTAADGEGVARSSSRNDGDGAVFVTAGAGTSMASVVDYCTEHGLAGMETFAGLPGTVGGAVYMNARCFGREIADVLAGADYVEGTDCSPVAAMVEKENTLRHCEGGCLMQTDPKQPLLVQHYDMDKADWSYKVSPFQGTPRVIVSAAFRVAAGDKAAIAEHCKGYIEERRKRGHFRAPCAGSVFRNNHDFGKPSGALIDEAGLKGMTIGGAQIAPWHGNIIVNTGTATARDVAALVKAAHDAVQKKTGYSMECEVVFCGAN